MVALSGAAENLEAARARVTEALESGEALECFRRNVEAQGGDATVCDEPVRLRDLTLNEVRVESPRAGFVAGVDAAEVGRAVASIGGGRVRMEDKIDPAVGYLAEARVGDCLAQGQVLGLLHCRGAADAEEAAARVLAAYEITEGPPAAVPQLFREVIDD
jgi:thymidine phosphorylase